MALLTVTKCHGTGNDFVLLDARGLTNVNYPGVARELCHRRFSIGGDGLLVIESPGAPGCDARMRIFNADGSEAQMCGNGIRCVTMFLRESKPGKTQFEIETASGIIHTEVVTSQTRPAVRVCMGIPNVARANLFARQCSSPPLGRLLTSGESSRAYDVSIGNAHVVIFETGDIQHVDLEQIAGAINKLNTNGVNVEIASFAPDSVFMRVHERGVGETWACGTGACAVAAAAITCGLVSSPVTVRSRGGAVEVEWSGPSQPVFLTGEANLVYQTQVEVPAKLSAEASTV
jgi:diaminopimelate epimerase